LQIINKKNPWPKGWGQKTSIMGVINLTPDSFSDGGELNSSKKVIDPAIKKLSKIKFTNITCHKFSMPLYPLGEWSFIKCVKA